MMKKLVSAMLAFALLLSVAVVPVSAHSNIERNTADALFQLKLFLGSGTTYALDDMLTREQGVTLLVRMLGKEEEAKAGLRAHPFLDVRGWSETYIAYAYAQKITNGTGNSSFSPLMTMTDQMFLTLCLRAIGYTDQGENKDFTFANPWDLSYTVGLVDSKDPNTSFTRADAVMVFWNLLNSRLKGSALTLADSLIAQGIFTNAAWENAVLVQKDGIGADDPTGETVVPVIYDPTDPTPDDPGETDPGQSDPAPNDPDQTDPDPVTPDSPTVTPRF